MKLKDSQTRLPRPIGPTRRGPQPSGPNPNSAWRANAPASASLFLANENGGWSIPEGGDDREKRLRDFLDNELAKVDSETYFLDRRDVWLNDERLTDVFVVMKRTHKRLGLAPIGAGDNRSIMRVLAKLYILVHLRALEKISELTLSQSTNQKSDRFVNVCDSVDLDSLVENVTHMLLYVLHLRYAKGGRETPIANQINAQYKSNAALTAHIEANGTSTQGRSSSTSTRRCCPCFAPRRRAWASRPWRC